jgi:hypothetical protein
MWYSGISDNTEIGESSPQFFLPNKASSVKRADLKDMFKKSSKSVCTLTAVMSPNPLSPTPSTSAVITPENTEEDPDDPDPADEGDIQMEYFSH